MPRRPKYVTDPKTFNKEFQRIVDYRKELAATKSEVGVLIEKLEDSSSLPKKVEKNLEELKSEYQRLQSLYSQTTTYINNIKNYHDNFEKIKAEITDELKEAEGQNSTLSSYKDEAASLKEGLTLEIERSKKLHDDAKNTLTLVTNSSLASVFIERSNDRKDSRKNWAWGVVLAFIAFTLGVFYAIENVAAEFNDDLTAWILKLIIIVPFAYFLYFVVHQYNHERDLEEKYAFKALISQTINNNTKLLQDEFVGDSSSNEEKILDFTIESLRAIYREPFRESNIRSRLKLNPRKTDFQTEIEKNERV